ncbi:MAG: hypothetical protein M1836_006869 [Candelina mexicana]|nr:MAG: hypothetical protein M1836_006869 [Candelina mexicana]
MTPYDNAGRIHKQAFLFTIDDGILLFGVVCLVVASGLLLKFVDKMYVVGASESSNLVHVSLPDDFISQAYDFHKLVTVALILTWCTIVCVKFSYLFLFRKLVVSMPRMTAYWWVAVNYNAVISIYGATVYAIGCPHYYSLKALQCVFGKGLRKSIAISESQMILDIVGDILIICIPCRLIWSVRLPWTQKLVLASTLCLTIITIFCTIIRIGGIRTGHTMKSIDSVWETYWQFIAADIAVTMTAATAFRAFFVKRGGDDRLHAQGVQDDVASETWYGKSWRLLRSIFSTRSWQSRRSEDYPRNPRERRDKWDDSPFKLREQIPRATMTGIRTFIGKQATTPSQMMRSVGHEEDQGDQPLSAIGRTSRYNV